MGRLAAGHHSSRTIRQKLARRYNRIIRRQKFRIISRVPFQLPNKTPYRNGTHEVHPVTSRSGQLNRSSKEALSPRETPSFPPYLLLDESVYFRLALLPASRNPRQMGVPCWVRPPVIGSSPQAVASSVYATAAGHHSSCTV